MPRYRATINGLVELTPEEEAELEALENAPPPPPPVPASITMRQARRALHQEGLLSQVEAAIQALPDPPKTEAIIEWEYSNEVQRYNGFVSQLAPILGLSEQDLDNLFILGASL